MYKILSYFPKQLATRCVIAYLLTLMLVSLIYGVYAMPFWLWLFGIISIFVFFIGSSNLTKSWGNIREHSYVQRIFWTALIIRLIYVIFIYYFNYAHYGTYYESNAGDCEEYVGNGLQNATWFAEGDWNVIAKWREWGVALDDIGECLYLGVLYFLTGQVSDVILPLLFKALYGAITCVLIFKIGTRHFGEHVGRMAGIFCVLNPNMIWWCGSMMKETEMILLYVLYANEMDKVLSHGSFKFREMGKAALVGLSLFTFRTALGLIAFASMFATVVLASTRIISAGKKIIAGLMVVGVLAFSFGQSLIETVQDTASKVTDTSEQKANMEWRMTRGDGNKYAKYAGAAVFAPLIFTIPFPSMVYTDQSQEMQMMVNGGNYIKNIFSYFVILVMFIVLFSGDWRKHVFPIALLCGYLLALVFSKFAQSGRFHMPILPLEMMFAAYGISIMKTKSQYERWFRYVLMIEVVVCLAWSYFKLAGRGWI